MGAGGTRCFDLRSAGTSPQRTALRHTWSMWTCRRNQEPWQTPQHMPAAATPLLLPQLLMLRLRLRTPTHSRLLLLLLLLSSHLLLLLLLLLLPLTYSYSSISTTPNHNARDSGVATKFFAPSYWFHALPHLCRLLSTACSTTSSSSSFNTSTSKSLVTIPCTPKPYNFTP